MSQSGYVHLEVQVIRRETDKAFQCVLEDGRIEWFSKSQVTDAENYEAGDRDCTLWITEWIANQKGMTTFHGGPADRKTLLLRRSPEYLRVVAKKGKFDALDAPVDQPEIAETISVYRLRKEGESVHFCMRGGKGGTFRVCEYEFVEEQPGEDVLRLQQKWNEWIAAKLAAQPKGEE